MLWTGSLGVLLFSAWGVAVAGGDRDGPLVPTPAPGALTRRCWRAFAEGRCSTWRGEAQRVGYANMARLAPQPGTPRPAGVEIAGGAAGLLELHLHLRWHTHDLDHFMTSLNVVGLLVITDGRFFLERYARDHTADTPWESWSVAKSVMSLLLAPPFATAESPPSMTL